MSKIKKVPLKEEQEYIKLDTELEALIEKITPLKLKMLKYHEKHYSFSLLKMSDTSAGAFCPPWKTIAMELLAKVYPAESAQKRFITALKKRFPKREKAPRIIILGKPVKTREED